MKQKADGSRVTLKDIAQKTGYAINTVSKAIRDAPDLAEETKRAIRKIADEMGYITNESANSLRCGLTMTLALIVADITNPLFAIIEKEIEEKARQNGYMVLVINTDENSENELNAVRAAIGKNVDGVMLFQTQINNLSTNLLEKAGIPYVLLYRIQDNQMCDAILIDEEKGGYLAGRRLIEAGRKHIVMITVPSYVSSSALRKNGFVRAMNEANMDDNYRVIYLDSAMESCGEAVRKLFSGNDVPDGIFCFSDIMAFDAACTLMNMGVDIPKDVSLVGFDNIQSKLPVPFPLTTVAIHKSELAKDAVTLLLRRIANDYENYPARKVIPVQLIERGSV